MAAITIHTRLESETLVLPQIRHLVGKRVEIRVLEEPASAIDRLVDTEFHAECEADTAPVPSLEEVREILAKIPGNMSDDIRAERDERY